MAKLYSHEYSFQFNPVLKNVTLNCEFWLCLVAWLITKKITCRNPPPLSSIVPLVETWSLPKDAEHLKNQNKKVLFKQFKHFRSTIIILIKNFHNKNTKKVKYCILFSPCYCSSTAVKFPSNTFILQIQVHRFKRWTYFACQTFTV